MASEAKGREFPGGPVRLGLSTSPVVDPGLIPGQGTKIQQAAWTW